MAAKLKLYHSLHCTYTNPILLVLTSHPLWSLHLSLWLLVLRTCSRFGTLIFFSIFQCLSITGKNLYRQTYPWKPWQGCLETSERNVESPGQLLLGVSLNWMELMELKANAGMNWIIFYIIRPDSMTRTDESPFWRVRPSAYFTTAGMMSRKRKEQRKESYKVKSQFPNKCFSCKCMNFIIRQKYCKHIASTIIRNLQ